MSEQPRVVVTGHRNGVIWRYADRQWTEIGKVRKEQLGPCCWKAFASWDTYTEDTNRDRVIRIFLRRIGVDPAELRPPQRPVKPSEGSTDTRDTPTGAHGGAQGPRGASEPHPVTTVTRHETTGTQKGDG